MTGARSRCGRPRVGTLCWFALPLLVLVAAGCANKPANVVGETPVEITASELKARIADGKPPVILDVREPVERESSRIEGSLHIPLGELESRLGELRKEDEIVVYCASGSRSAEAVEMLRAHGYARARNLKGGMFLWRSANSP